MTFRETDYDGTSLPTPLDDSVVVIPGAFTRLRDDVYVAFWKWNDGVENTTTSYYLTLSDRGECYEIEELSPIMSSTRQQIGGSAKPSLAKQILEAGVSCPLAYRLLFRSYTASGVSRKPGGGVSEYQIIVIAHTIFQRSDEFSLPQKRAVRMNMSGKTRDYSASYAM
jgi:hypothetical protein